jgi:capsular exopolysaccharide synthesis family protein
MVAREPGISDLASFPQGSDAGARLISMVSASAGRRDEVITVTVRSEYREDAAKIANAVVLTFVKYRESTGRSTARELLDLLQNKKAEQDRLLDQKRQAMHDFQLKNPTFSFGGDHNNPTVDRLGRLAAALTDAHLNTLNAQSAYETAKAMMDDPAKVRQLLETRQFKSETAQLRAELRQLQVAQLNLSQVAGKDNSQLAGVQEGIKRLQNEMIDEDRRIVEAYLEELSLQLKSARTNEQYIEQALNEQRKDVAEFNSKAADYAVLASELQSTEAFNNIINDRIKELSLTEGGGAMNIRKVDSARPGPQVEPNVKATLAMSLLLGGMIGTMLAFLRDWMDQRLRSAEEIKHVLGLPVLGVVPHIVDAHSPSKRGTHLHHDPMSDVAEAYRTVRTAVYFGQANGIAKTLLITSPAPGDGKTTLASNLAIAMAQAGNRILLLDADFRKPTQHKIFELDKRIGLSSVLAGEAQLADAIHHTAVNGLDVLPCGPIPANPSEILNSQTFADLLKQLAAKYDHVLLDSPPIMPVTDARILAASCDATVLALRAERSTRKGAIYSRDVLQSVGSQILGVVVNDVPRRKGVYGYYYTYGENYQYGYGNRRNGGGSSSSGSSPAPAGKEKGNGSSTAGGPPPKAAPAK